MKSALRVFAPLLLEYRDITPSRKLVRGLNVFDKLCSHCKESIGSAHFLMFDFV